MKPINIEKIRLFHITAISNLEGICLTQNLRSKNNNNTHAVTPVNLADPSIQDRRSHKEVLVNGTSHGQIHDYVPFYFAPRSPMLYSIIKGNVPEVDMPQEDIITLQSTVGQIIQSAQRSDFVFYDRNAATSIAAPYNDLQSLTDKIDWELIYGDRSMDGFSKFFHNEPDNRRHDRKQKRMAEFLVKDQVPLPHIEMIGVYDKRSLEAVQQTLSKYGLTHCVQIKTQWYF